MDKQPLKIGDKIEENETVHGEFGSHVSLDENNKVKMVLGNVYKNSQPSTHKESWEDAYEQFVLNYVDDCLLDEGRQVLRGLISSAVTTEKQRLIQRLEKEKASTQTLSEQQRDWYREGLYKAISIIKEEHL